MRLVWQAPALSMRDVCVREWWSVRGSWPLLSNLLLLLHPPLPHRSPHIPISHPLPLSPALRALTRFPYYAEESEGMRRGRAVTHTHTRTHIHTQTHTNLDTNVRTHIQMLYLYANTHTHTPTHIQTHTNLYTNVFTHIQTAILIHKHTHTHTHTIERTLTKKARTQIWL